MSEADSLPSLQLCFSLLSSNGHSLLLPHPSFLREAFVPLAWASLFWVPALFFVITDHTGLSCVYGSIRQPAFAGAVMETDCFCLIIHHHRFQDPSAPEAGARMQLSQLALFCY